MKLDGFLQPPATDSSFFSEIWTLLRPAFLIGHFPVKIHLNKKGAIKIKITKLSSAYFLALFVVLNSFAMLSHLSAKYGQKLQNSPLSYKVALFQITALSVAAVIGAVNTFNKRHDLVKVR